MDVTVIDIKDKVWEKLLVLSEYFQMNTKDVVEKIINASYTEHIEFNDKLSENEILKIVQEMKTKQ